MHESNDEALCPAVERAAALLREPPAVRAEWRQQLLLRVAQPSEGPMVPSRRWSARPSVAIAAALLCAVAGSMTTLAIVRRAQLSSDRTIAMQPGASQVRFELVAPNAVHVSIVGDFNQWNPAALPLRRRPDGRTWEIVVPLAPGRYTYAFVVDGRIARDTTAAQSVNDGFGIPNSVLLVKGT